MSPRRVVVVGGGLSGISAALHCARGGGQVTLLEARGRLGGAAYSFHRGAIRVDNGQHVFLRCCTAYRQLLDDLGASDLVTLQPRLDIPVLRPGGRRSRLRRSDARAPLHLAAGFARYRWLSAADRAAVARAAWALGRLDADDPRVDARSFGDWLTEQRQSPAAVEALWELIVRPALNLPVAGASLAQVAQVFQVGLLRDRAAADIGYARVPLGAIHDGAAGRALARAGVDVRLRRGVTALSSVRAGFCLEMSAAPSVETDAIILAVPPDRAARLLPREAGLSRVALAGLGRSPIVDLHVILQHPILDVPFAAGIGTPVQWIFDRTAASGVTTGQYLVVSLSAADAEVTMSVDDLRERYLPALVELLPTLRPDDVRDFFVTREHAATFCAAPGARALRPDATTRVPGLVLAGAWTDTGWPATMEGAVRSGRRAAERALAALRRPAAPASEPLAPPRRALAATEAPA